MSANNIPQQKEQNIFDKITNELDLIEQLFYSQTYPYTIEQIRWSQHNEGRYCNEIYINSEVNLFEISKYKNYYTNRIDKNNSELLKNEMLVIYGKANELYNYFLRALKDHKDKKDYYVGNDGRKQIIESTVLFIVRQYQMRMALYCCDVEAPLYKNYTKDGITTICKNETLINFCVQLIDFIDLTGVLVKSQQSKISVPDDEVYKKENWFIIGLLFANGEMDKLLNKHNRNGTQIAKELGNVKGFRPYITESIGVKKLTGSKSIFSNKEKMNKIILHCEKSGIALMPDFINALPLE